MEKQDLDELSYLVNETPQHLGFTTTQSHAVVVGGAR